MNNHQCCESWEQNRVQMPHVMLNFDNVTVGVVYGVSLRLSPLVSYHLPGQLYNDSIVNLQFLQGRLFKSAVSLLVFLSYSVYLYIGSRLSVCCKLSGSWELISIVSAPMLSLFSICYIFCFCKCNQNSPPNEKKRYYFLKVCQELSTYVI